MDPGLRRAWTEIVTADDYEEHMTSIGQAQAAAELTRRMIELASLPAFGRIAIVGAGTGQMFDLLAPAVFRQYRLTCSDLNPAFLARLKERLAARGLSAEVVEDDFENTALEPAPDLLLATLLLEHIDWCRGVERFAALRPRACAIILQENPPDLATAVTPGRHLPPSIARAVEMCRPMLVPKADLIPAMAAHGYICREEVVREVADGKRLIAILFERSMDDNSAI